MRNIFKQIYNIIVSVCREIIKYCNSYYNVFSLRVLAGSPLFPSFPDRLRISSGISELLVVLFGTRLIISNGLEHVKAPRGGGEGRGGAGKSRRSRRTAGGTKMRPLRPTVCGFSEPAMCNS